MENLPPSTGVSMCQVPSTYFTLCSIPLAYLLLEASNSKKTLYSRLLWLAAHPLSVLVRQKRLNRIMYPKHQIA